MRRYGWVALFLVLLSGCGGGAAVDPQALARSSADRFDKVGTFHFKMDVSQGQPAAITSALGDILILGAEGDVKRPQMMSGTLKVQTKGALIAVNVKAIVLGKDAYLSN